MNQTTLPHDATGYSVRSFEVEVQSSSGEKWRKRADGDILTIGSGPDNDLSISDPTVSQYHLEIRRTAEGLLVRDNNSTNGTEIGSARIKLAIVRPGTVLRCGLVKIRIDDAEVVTTEATASDRVGGILGRDPAMRHLMAQVSRCAQSDVSVLIEGETGTGKEVVARTLHSESDRADGPMEVVDCGTLLPTLIASELFGHEKGAFTGAERTRIGAFERANGGTLFLDEIGELPISLQPALLGTLERRTFRRVGGDTPISVDVRVVSATHRDLRTRANEGTFRADLLYRLGVVWLRIPPLRDRRADIPMLAEHFLDQMGRTDARGEVLNEDFMDLVDHHGWPGNVRELRNLVEATVALGQGMLPMAMHQPESEASAASAGTPNGWRVGHEVFERPYREARAAVLESFEVRFLRNLLKRTGGNVSKAAREGGINRSYLRELIAKHEIS